MNHYHSKPAPRSKVPGIVISALRGGSGKTILSLGIITAWRQSGLNISPFKKGPDYIDAGWLGLAACQPCYNLDNFLLTEETVIQSFCKHTQNCDVAVVEGNRGIFDGIEIKGSTSTAEIAKLLRLPVILCLDCTKSTRTMAAVIKGIMAFDDELKVGGILLNRVAGARHESILRNSIEHYCDVKVYGAIPKLKHTDIFPERHMGLVPRQEHQWALESTHLAAEIARNNTDLDGLYTQACQMHYPLEPDRVCSVELSDSSVSGFEQQYLENSTRAGKPKIGIIQDSAFQFYYSENIEALMAAGADIVITSPLKDTRLPKIDALYIGGGFPETHAPELDQNRSYADSLLQCANQGLPIYAECGGLIYLGKEIEIEQKRFRMAGVLPIIFGISKIPQGHGYTINEVEKENPFFRQGEVIRGHEFRYSKVLEWRGSDDDLALRSIRGTGFFHHRDGIVYKNVFAAYTHLHALGVPQWAPAMVNQARQFLKIRADA